MRTGAIVLGGVLTLWIATGVTLNFTAAQQAPAPVEGVWPAGAAAKVAQGLALLADAAHQSAASMDDARTALREAALREPVNTQALGTLAALDEYRNDDTRGRALFHASEAVSRRNTLSELWLIEDAVGRKDIAGAIKHYDRAMLVSNDARRTLMPILATASSDPAILRELLPVLAGRPSWWKDYILQLSASGDSAGTMAAVLRVTRLDVRNVDDSALAQLILHRMIAIKDGRAAILAANRLEGGGGSTRALRDGGFETSSNLLPFAWWLRDEAGIRAYRDTIPNGTTGLRITTSSDASGPVAQQLIGLAPGDYVLRGTAGDVSTDETARPAIDVVCETGRSLSHFALPASDGRGRNFRFAFNIPPADCPLQWVTIVTAPAVDTNIWLDNLATTY